MWSDWVQLLTAYHALLTKGHSTLGWRLVSGLNVEGLWISTLSFLNEASKSQEDIWLWEKPRACSFSRPTQDWERQRRQTLTCLKQTLLFKFQEYANIPIVKLSCFVNFIIFFKVHIWILISCVVLLWVSPKTKQNKEQKNLSLGAKKILQFLYMTVCKMSLAKLSQHIPSATGCFDFLIALICISVSITNCCVHRPVCITSHLWQNWGSVANKTTRCACLSVVYGTKTCHITLVCLLQFERNTLCTKYIIKDWTLDCTYLVRVYISLVMWS